MSKMLSDGFHVLHLYDVVCPDVINLLSYDKLDIEKRGNLNIVQSMRRVGVLVDEFYLG